MHESRNGRDSVEQQRSTARAGTRPDRPAHLPAAVGLPLAVIAGVALPIQGRINGALGARIHDGLAAAVVSFSTGLVLMLAVSVLFPKGRSGLRALLPAVRHRSFPRWYLLAGGIGAFFVLAQSLTVSLIGIALFTVAAVTGQTLSGLWVDRIGLGPAGRKPVNGLRVLGALLTIGAVVWAVSPRFGQGTAVAGWLLPVLLPLTAGFLMSFQQGMNGTQSVHYGTPITATLTNFATGTAALWIAWFIKDMIFGPGSPLPADWWYYVAGPLGCLFIGMTALLVRSLGVLLTGLGTIAGQLLGSLGLDVLFPAPGTSVALATVLGTFLTLGAIVVAALPWKGAQQDSNRSQRR